MQSNLPDPSLVRGLTQRRLGRRDALRVSGLSAFAMALAACGVKGTGSTAPSAPAADAVAEYWAGKTSNGKVDFANWPLYMDPKQPELKKFTAATGVKVNYQEVIQEMGPWFAKVQPQLAAGQSIGYDLMVITNGIQFKQFVDSGFLAPLDHSKLPNYVANADKSYADTAYDKGNVYSVPWTSATPRFVRSRTRVLPPLVGATDRSWCAERSGCWRPSSTWCPRVAAPSALPRALGDESEEGPDHHDNSQDYQGPQ